MKWNSLRDVPTDVLQRELAARGRCVDCKTEWSSSWYPCGTNRVRCRRCQAIARLQAWRESKAVPA